MHELLTRHADASASTLKVGIIAGVNLSNVGAVAVGPERRGVKTVSVGVVKSILTVETADTIVEVGVVVGTSNLGSVGSLVHDNLSAILAVAVLVQISGTVEEVVAVRNLVLVRVSDSSSTTGTTATGISAVGTDFAATKGLKLASSTVKDTSNNVTGVAVRSLEVLIHTVGRTVASLPRGNPGLGVGIVVGEIELIAGFTVLADKSQKGIERGFLTIGHPGSYRQQQRACQCWRHSQESWRP